MNNKFTILLSCMLITNAVFANTYSTKRTPQFETDKVRVWETIIYPSAKQVLKMHRHEYDRVLVAFDSGTLKVRNDKGSIHFINLQKNKSYYLTKDIPGEMHTDENIGRNPIKVLVMELKR